MGAKDCMFMNAIIERQIGNNIRILREKANITQEQLSAKLQICGCDITRSAIAKIEVGQRHLYPDEILLIKEILHVSFEEIFMINN
ncbi:MAG: helix-turn-helix domain-containing protein [Clostridia bacterium]|nr:helix-turn-helix domain-containing protein [Clostridia bacterium]